MIIQKGTTTIIIPKRLEVIITHHELMHELFGNIPWDRSPRWWLECQPIMARAHVVPEKVRKLLQTLAKWYTTIDALERS